MPAHNTSLSPLDAAAGHFFQVLKAFMYRGAMRAQGARKPGGIDMYTVDGALVERWLLKIVVNLMFNRETATGRWRPPDDWVECVHGRRRFADRCGLYWLQGKSSWAESELSDMGVRLLTRSDNDDRVIGGQLRMENLQFVVAMEPLDDKHRKRFRVPAIRDEKSQKLRQVIRFDWSNLSSPG